VCGVIAAYDALAKILARQGVKIVIDEMGSPVLDGGEVRAILETLDEGEQKALVEAMRRLQQRQ
jgi:hypothetical protein